MFRFTLIAKFMGSTWGPAGADRTQVGPMFATRNLLSGYTYIIQRHPRPSIIWVLRRIIHNGHEYLQWWLESWINFYAINLPNKDSQYALAEQMGHDKIVGNNSREFAALKWFISWWLFPNWGNWLVFKQKLTHNWFSFYILSIKSLCRFDIKNYLIEW